jgi:hypothetical protein
MSHGARQGHASALARARQEQRSIGWHARTARRLAAGADGNRWSHLRQHCPPSKRERSRAGSSKAVGLQIISRSVGQSVSWPVSRSVSHTWNPALTESFPATDPAGLGSCLGNAYGTICCAAGNCAGQAACPRVLPSPRPSMQDYYPATFQLVSKTLPLPACTYVPAMTASRCCLVALAALVAGRSSRLSAVAAAAPAQTP